MPPKGQKYLLVYGPTEFIEQVKKAAALEPDGNGGVGMSMSKFVKVCIAESLRKRFGTGKKPKVPQHLRGLASDD